MSYEPKTWECGDVITAEDLNHLENGLVTLSSALESLIDNSGAFIIEATGNMPNLTADKTFEELLQAINNDRLCIIRWDASQGLGQQVMLYHLVKYTANGTNRTAYFTYSTNTSNNTTVQTLRMSEDGTITSA